MAGETGVHEAGGGVREQAETPEGRLALDPGGDVVRQRADLVRRPQDELARVQDEGLLTVGLDHPRQVRLVGSGVDVRVAMVFEDPEEAVRTHVDRRRLHHRRLPRLHHDPARVDLGEDVAVAQRRGHATGTTRGHYCSGTSTATSFFSKPNV